AKRRGGQAGQGKGCAHTGQQRCLRHSCTVCGRAGGMKIKHVETLSCDAGWRNYSFLKIVTDSGIVGWSEFDEAYSPPGLSAVIARYADRLTGMSVFDHELIYGTLAATARPAPYGLSAEAFGAIEN